MASAQCPLGARPQQYRGEIERLHQATAINQLRGPVRPVSQTVMMLAGALSDAVRLARSPRVTIARIMFCNLSIDYRIANTYSQCIREKVAAAAVTAACALVHWPMAPR